MTRDPLPQLLPEWRELPLYPTQEGRSTYTRMDFNEGPSPCLTWLSSQLSLCAYALTQYPEYAAIKAAAARAWGLNASQLMAVNGADEGVYLLLRAFTGPQNALLTVTPSFPMYAIYGAQCGSALIEIPLKEDFSLDLPNVLLEIKNASAVMLCSPNNPTGQCISEEELIEILEASASKPVIVDETYAPFCNQDFSHLLVRYSNLLILRSLSKAYGLPGVRTGFILGSSELIQKLETLKAPFNVNALGSLLGAQVLESDKALKGRLQRVVKAREDLQLEMERLGIPTLPSKTHFFLARMGYRTRSSVSYLKENGILIKDLSKTLPGTVRISVGESDQVESFLAVLKPFWKEGFNEKADA